MDRDGYPGGIVIQLSRWALFAALAAGCSFDGGGVGFDDDDAAPNPTADAMSADAAPDPTDAEPGAPDAGPPDAMAPDAGPDPILEDVVHVQAVAEFGGFADVVFSGANTIDTSNLEVNGDDVEDGATFAAAPHAGGGPELAILHVKSLTVSGGATVRVTGSRPLVVIASGPIVVDGVIDAGARRSNRGAGGSTSGAGAGAGGTGVHAGAFRDSGGGGAGYGAVGARGGNATCTPNCGAEDPATAGTAGVAYGDLAMTTLQGGSGGGASSPNCAADPAGAGGGAIQLYSGTSITIGLAGGINVSGGGGGAGRNCATNVGAASGGGSGGAVFLQSPMIDHNGTVAANGGGGGSSAAFDGVATRANGNPGENGPFGSGFALGGMAVGMYSQSGGNGGSALTGATAGGDDSTGDGNGGGGGGGVGRIVFIYKASGGLDVTGSTTSPGPTTATY